MARLLRVTSLKTSSAVLSYLPIEGQRRKSNGSSGSSGGGSSSEGGHAMGSDSCHTCSTCSLTDREQVFKKAPTSSSSASSSAALKQPLSLPASNHRHQHSPAAAFESLDNRPPPPARSTKPKRYQSPVHPPPPPPPPPPMLAPSQPSASRYNYTSLLTEGQLYFRSWQELDVRLRHSGPFPMLNSHPGLMKPSSAGSGNGSDHVRKSL